MPKVCKNPKCYNETNEGHEFCFDCEWRQAEDKAKSINN